MNTSNKKVKGLILAAGLGSRLRPISNHIPKPLWPLAGVCLLDIAINKLRNGGVEDICVNIHHLSQQIKSFLSSKHPDIHISVENKLLGTGGALAPIRDWINGSNLLIYNSDIISEISLDHMVECHDENHIATMVLLSNPEPNKNPVAFNEKGITAIRRKVPGDQFSTFSGIHILSPQFLEKVPPEGFSDIIDIYIKHLEAGSTVGHHRLSGYWKDLGTPEDFFDANVDFIQLSEEDRHNIGWYNPGVQFSEKTITDVKVEMDDTVTKGFVFLYDVPSIQGNTRIENAIIFNTPHIETGDYSNVIIHNHTTIQLSM